MLIQRPVSVHVFLHWCLDLYPNPLSLRRNKGPTCVSFNRQLNARWKIFFFFYELCHFLGFPFTDFPTLTYIVNPGRLQWDAFWGHFAIIFTCCCLFFFIIIHQHRRVKTFCQQTESQTGLPAARCAPSHSWLRPYLTCGHFRVCYTALLMWNGSGK